ncbi:MAG: D-2-hydroxyacid dehydrogenase [Bryobacteraceae bacterium]|nr:D-2-hydroxyacid dehydrogenase [Bryobacterales bacterium]MEB2363272.1 D-2-hydroxyacid dehydrogenase [Bryobacterales bacterium]NUN00390.1 D-2-hydroxyacid dehydrogenase [Bryobacteraceae bacterium]
MSEYPVSRRAFVGGAASVPVTATPSLQSVSATRSGPIRIVTMYPFEAQEAAKIRAAASKTKVDLILCKDRDEFRKNLREAEVVYGALRGADLDYAQKVRWVQAGGAGVENMDKRFRESPIVLTNFARTFAPGISETGIGLLLCLTRGISKYYMPQFYKRQMKPVGTPKSDHHTELKGRTMGVVGMGGIGSAISRRAYYGFDMRIVGTDAKPMPAPEYVAELRDPGWFEEMVPQVDVLVAAAPHTPETERMFNEKIFRSMKKTAYFLGLSRGMLFDDIALVRALKEGWIAGAGLDVFPVEPPPSSHPIYDCPNVVMTAHTSGWSPDRQVRLIDLFAENVRRYASGLPLINVVDKQKGY